MNPFLLPLILGGAGYLCFIAIVLFGLYRLRGGNCPPTLNPETLPFVSIIVPVHNAQSTVGATVRALLHQDYPSSRYELIFVDDRSTDETEKEIRDHYNRSFSSFPLPPLHTSSSASPSPPLTIIRQEELLPGLTPKKSAITRAIGASRGELIATTDGDCLPPPQWLSTMVGSLGEREVMVVGQVRFRVSNTDRLWQRLQALDYQAQMVCAAGLVGAGFPINCAGASLLYRKWAFEEAGGFSQWGSLASGDDELLMQAFAKRYPIGLLTSAQGVVLTAPPPNWKSLWHQRARWSSKVHRYSLSRRLLLGAIFLFYLNLALTPIALLLSSSLAPWIVAWSGKLILDGWVLWRGKKLYGDPLSPLLYLLAQAIHPYFILSVSIKGLTGSFNWQEREYHRGVEVTAH